MRHSAVVLLVLFAATSCSGDSTMVREETLFEAEDVVAMAAPDLSTTCFEVPPGRFVDVSDNGSLWFLDGTTITSLNVAGGSLAYTHGIVVSGSTELDLLSAANLRDVEGEVLASGLAVVRNEFWRFTDEGARFEWTPMEVATNVESFCGDPGQSGAAILSRGSLFVRLSERWHTLSFAEEPWTNVTWLGQIDGACRSSGNAFWVLDAREDFSRLARLGESTGHYWDFGGVISENPVLSSDYVALLQDVQIDRDGELVPEQHLWLTVNGPANDELVKRYKFQSRVTSMSGSSSNLWALAGESLYRYQDDTWAQVSLLDGTSLVLPSATVVGTPAGSAWVLNGTEACHVGPSTFVEVSGVRPFEEFFLGTRTLEVTITGAMPSSVELRVDNQTSTTTGTLGSNGAWQFPNFFVGSPGWHDLTVLVDGAEMRTLRYRRLSSVSFADEVAPISEAFCATAGCHDGVDASGAADLSGLNAPLLTYEQWVNNADAIRDRVGQNIMPFQCNQTCSCEDCDECSYCDAWDDAAKITILDWLEGLQP